MSAGHECAAHTAPRARSGAPPQHKHQHWGWQSDILSPGTVKAHNDMRQNNTAQLTDVWSWEGGGEERETHIKRTCDTEHRGLASVRRTGELVLVTEGRWWDVRALTGMAALSALFMWR